MAERWASLYDLFTRLVPSHHQTVVTCHLRREDDPVTPSIYMDPISSSPNPLLGFAFFRTTLCDHLVY